jgi:Ca2+-binding EF-hand superfamily protein
MTPRTLCVAFALATLPALGSLPGCGSSTEQAQTETGSLKLPILATAPSGITYRLSNGTIDIVGAQNITFNTNDYSSQTSILTNLTPGNYTLNLLTGWQLQRVEAGGTTDVDATLVTPVPIAFQIQSDSLTGVQLLFATDGGEVVFGDGQLEVTVAVDDSIEQPDAENTVARCSDGVDNDADGYVDCQDFDCQALDGLCEQGAENTAARCSDGIDNDGNGYVDCDDFGCSGLGACSSSSESGAASCSDGIDNDGDGYIDCRDFDCDGFNDCERFEQSCSDGIDNDGDGLTDCEDNNCAASCGPTAVENTSALCSDGIDNDADGAVDCADSECASFPNCDPLAENTDLACSDGVDNDGNGYMDCADWSCAGLGGCPSESDVAACSDGIDNDGDGYIDCNDFNCNNVVGVCGN